MNHVLNLLNQVGVQTAQRVPSSTVHMQVELGRRGCEAWCSAACRELTGNIRSECGLCGRSSRCRPDAEDFPHATIPDMLPDYWRNLPYQPEQLERGANRSHAEHCGLLADTGFCKRFWRQIGRFCPAGTCRQPLTWSDQENTIDTKSWTNKWGKLSLSDFRQYDPTRCRGEAARRHWGRHETLCSDLENDARVEEHGWFVWRGIVPREEIEAMAAAHSRIPEPARSMCGAGGFQPRACFLNPNKYPSLYPRFHRALTDRLQSWIATGFHERASLGWPLEPQGGEFISINSYKGPRSQRCLVRALFQSADKAESSPEEGSSQPTVSVRPTISTQGPPQWRSRSSNSSLTACIAHSCGAKRHDDLDEYQPFQKQVEWLDCMAKCYWQAVVKLPPSTLRMVIAAPQCNGSLKLLPWLSRMGSFEEDQDQYFKKARGGGVIHDFGYAHYRGLLTAITKDSSAFTTYHPWHQDGPPGNFGRLHKLFVLISKNWSTGEAPKWNARRTNLATCSAEARYAHNCVYAQQSAAKQGANSRWQPVDFECTPEVQPGDAVFFREDVWHKTQDTLVDRVALIVDIFRLPLRIAPAGADRDLQLDAQNGYKRDAHEKAARDRAISLLSRRLEARAEHEIQPWSPAPYPMHQHVPVARQLGTVRE